MVGSMCGILSREQSGYVSSFACSHLELSRTRVHVQLYIVRLASLIGDNLEEAMAVEYQAVRTCPLRRVSL